MDRQTFSQILAARKKPPPSKLSVVYETVSLLPGYIIRVRDETMSHYYQAT